MSRDLLSQQRLELAFAADEGSSPGRGRASPGDHRVVERRVLTEDPLLELSQFLSRLDPELIDENAPRVAIDVERLDLPPRSVKRQHELGADALAQGVLRYQPFELADDIRVTPQGKIGVEPILQRDEAKLFEARNVR